MQSNVMNGATMFKSAHNQKELFEAWARAHDLYDLRTMRVLGGTYVTYRDNVVRQCWEAFSAGATGLAAPSL